jgi:murein DD-endopeptidase MepM/ murein hydrolase activator NlpD
VASPWIPRTSRRTSAGAAIPSRDTPLTIKAVAAGVVSWAGKRNGYGNLVELNHGNGLTTRYGHNSKNLVAVGDRVERGQVIALMGSTGRSTGPHLHFEVLQDGRSRNPMAYIRDTE